MSTLRRDDPLRAAWQLLRPRRSRLALAILLGVASLGSALALAGVAAWLIAKAWQMPPVLDLSVAAVAVRALGISRGLLGYCERLASHDTALRAAGTARTTLYRTLASAPQDVVARLPRGVLLSRLGASVDDVADVLVRAVLPIAVAAVLGVAAVGVIAVISPLAAVVLAGGLAVAGVAAPWLSARAAAEAERGASEQRTARDAAASLALEHAAELEVNGKLGDVITETARRQRDWSDAVDRAARPSALAAAAPVVALAVSALAAVFVAMTLAPSVTPTTLAILMLLPLSAFEATTALPGAAIQLGRARVAMQHLRDLTAADPTSRGRPDLEPLDVAPGDRVAVVGPSGCGKTSLLLATSAEGATGFFGEDAHVFDTTLRDNLLVARGDATDAELTDALRRVGLGPWLEQLPDGLSTLLVEGAAAVSAGQRRRLLLARACVSDFATVLLDEPTEHLDADDAARLLTELLDGDGLFGPERAVVVATHQLPEGVPCEVVRPGADGYPRRS